MKFIYLIIIFILIDISAFGQEYYKITGTVLESKNNNPLPYATIYLTGSNSISTATNIYGDFILKVPIDFKADSLKIYLIGFITKTISIKQINSDLDLNIIELNSYPITLKEVTIRPINPNELIDKAINQIPINYDSKPLMMDGYYHNLCYSTPVDFQSKYFDRDTFDQEAVLSIYRNPYLNIRKKKEDLLKVLAWKQNKDYKNSIIRDSLGLMGFPLFGILDKDLIADVNNSFLNKTNRKKYDIKLIGTSIYDNIKVYEIIFDQKDNVREQLYKGIIFLEIETLALVYFQYELSPKGKIYNKLYHFLSFGKYTKLDNGKILYHKFDDKWNLAMIRLEKNYDWLIYNNITTKKYFKRYFPNKDRITYNNNSNIILVITGINKNDVIKFSNNDLFTDKTKLKKEINKNNTDIWGKYNYIK